MSARATGASDAKPAEASARYIPSKLICRYPTLLPKAARDDMVLTPAPYTSEALSRALAEAHS